MPTEEELYEQVLAQYYRDNEQGNDQNARPNNNIPLGGDASLSPTLDYDGRVILGLKGQRDGVSGHANVGVGMTGPQNVNAGISGRMGSLGANIPISDPEALRLSGETDIAGNIITADWTPMEKALLFQLSIPTN